MPEATFNDNCHCGKLLKDHNVQDMEDCELTSASGGRGWDRIVLEERGSGGEEI